MTQVDEDAGPGVLIEHSASACSITINRPKHHNAMTLDVLRDLARGFDTAADNHDARAVVLTGAGTKTFCAGGQLVASDEGSPFELDAERFDNPVALLFRAMDRCPLPIIGRINGSAFGGGIGLICACDIAVAVDTAKFGTTEARLGVFPLMILPLMMRVIPRRHLHEMCFFAERFAAQKALAIGLVNEVVAPEALDGAIAAIVEKLRLNSPTALTFGRRAINAVSDLALADALNLTQALLPLLAQSDDAREGFRAFAERRPPVWKKR
jgi:enoyl-CoA hydratase/carnithine racemase